MSTTATPDRGCVYGAGSCSPVSKVFQDLFLWKTFVQTIHNPTHYTPWRNIRWKPFCRHPIAGRAMSRE